MHFLDIQVVFRLDLRQISFNPVENAFATQQLAFLAIAFYHIVTWACAEIKILRMTYVSRFFDIWNFFRLSIPFSPFLFFLLLQSFTFYCVCLRLKNFSESVIETGNF